MKVEVLLPGETGVTRVGGAVGVELAVMLGSSVGIAVGAIVGVGVGREVGVAVGVGEGAGVTVGAIVGVADGVADSVIIDPEPKTKKFWIILRVKPVESKVSIVIVCWPALNGEDGLKVQKPFLSAVTSVSIKSELMVSFTFSPGMALPLNKGLESVKDSFF